MTTQINVVDINDNPNADSTNAKAKPRNGLWSKTPTLNSTECCLQARAKAKVKEEINEEVKQEVLIIEDDATRRAQPCPSSIKKEEITPKNRKRPELKEKANCPDCGKKLILHGLKVHT